MTETMELITADAALLADKHADLTDVYVVLTIQCFEVKKLASYKLLISFRKKNDLLIKSA